MPVVKLTVKSVEKLVAPDPSGKQVAHWDAELKGFGVLCSGVSNSKTYVAQRVLPDSRTRRVAELRQAMEAVTMNRLPPGTRPPDLLRRWSAMPLQAAFRDAISALASDADAPLPA